MKQQIILRLHEDEATGEYGLAPEESFNGNYSCFNSFWNGIGIFHDVFEHYFEKRHKYFMGDYAFNVAGEIAAMGHMAYYIEDYRVREARRLSPQSIYADEESIVNTTHSIIQEAVTEGYCNFGDTLQCIIPRQREEQSYVLNEVIQYHIHQLAKLKSKAFKGYEEEKDSAFRYRSSISPAKIRNLYLWGYKQARKIIPDIHGNAEIVGDFIRRWNNICSVVDAKHLTYDFSHIVFYRWLDKDKQLKWCAKAKDRHNKQLVNIGKVIDMYL